MRYWIIAANHGYDESIQVLKRCHHNGGFVSKEDLAAALRAHQAAVDATKSPQMEAAWLQMQLVQGHGAWGSN